MLQFFPEKPYLMQSKNFIPTTFSFPAQDLPPTLKKYNFPPEKFPIYLEHCLCGENYCYPILIDITNTVFQ